MSRAWRQRRPSFPEEAPTPPDSYTPGSSDWARQGKQGKAWEECGRGENVEQCGGDGGYIGQTGKKEVISGDSELLGSGQEEMAEPKSAWQRR